MMTEQKSYFTVLYCNSLWQKSIELCKQSQEKLLQLMVVSWVNETWKRNLYKIWGEDEFWFSLNLSEWFLQKICPLIPRFCDTRVDSEASPGSFSRRRWGWECSPPPHEPRDLPLSQLPPLKLRRRVKPHWEEKTIRCLSLFSQKYSLTLLLGRFKDLRGKSWNPFFKSSKKCIHKHLKIWF